jgi:DNA-binding PadR family transcriptional regulator
LLKLLDEAPRHGYEVIRLLQDRFMGVYAPSPGTIYPRLARLEEDGLVTHEEVDGKKVYSITDKGREEIRSRLGDLADLEDELTESLRDVAREISVDVRDTVRTIREELASAAREFRMHDTGMGDRAKDSRADSKTDSTATADRSGVADESATPDDQAASEPGADTSDDARRIRDEAHRTREQMRADFRARNRGNVDWAGWSAWSEWASWKDWAGKDWGGRDWTRGKDWGGGSGPGGDQPGGEEAGRRGGPRGGKRRGGPNPFSDLEGLAIQFANELRAAAIQTGNIGERSLNDLRDILTDTLAKVRDEVFGSAGSADRADSADSASRADRADSAGSAGSGDRSADDADDSSAHGPGPGDAGETL